MRLLPLLLAMVIAACPKTSPIEGETGPTGPTGSNGTAGASVKGATGATGATGPEGPQGAKGDPGQVTVLDGGTIQGPPGVTGETGPTGPAGTSAQITTLAPGDATCPTGGVRISVGAMSTAVCNGAVGGDGAKGATGATGSAGPAGATGSAGAAATISALSNGNTNCPYGGTQITVGTSTTYACNGAPANGGTATYSGGVPPVTFAGYTPQTYGGNLGGRSGANALCGAAYASSHFCTDWEADEADPPPAPTSGAWIDLGNQQTSVRTFHYTYSNTNTDDCLGWTTSATSPAISGTSGWTLTSQGGFASTYSPTDSGCDVQRPLACCKGGTAVRFRGFTPATMGGNLGGRSGAHAICGAAYSGSHFCTDWEVDQANVPAPIPASGAWIDLGNDQTSVRVFHYTYSNTNTDSCLGWTTSAASPAVSGTSGWTLTPLGGFASTYSPTDSGCDVARPLACCDGYPPQ